MTRRLLSSRFLRTATHPSLRFFQSNKLTKKFLDWRIFNSSSEIRKKVTLIIYFSFSPSLSPSLSHSIFLTHSLSLFLLLFNCFSLTLAIPHSLSLSLFFSLSFSLSLSLSLFISHSLTLYLVFSMPVIALLFLVQFPKPPVSLFFVGLTCKSLTLNG